jgi:choline dehydrogenase-like flavoprotein
MRVAVEEHIPADPESGEWDVVVVGTGMGGGTAGYELARRGRRVLYLEKGKFLHGGPGAEAQYTPDADPTEEARRLSGRWPKPLKGKTSFGKVEFYAPLGCGTAGTSGLFGAQLERLSPVDFQPRASFPNASDTDLPDEWPVRYDEMAPFYRRAEALYRVRGSQDPLNTDPDAALGQSPPMSDRDSVIFDSFVEMGLHPYRSHVGFQYVPNCYECADICPLGCKSDAAGVGVVPALIKYGASILPECEAVELSADATRVNAIRARWQGREITIRAKTFVLGAGAYMTPILLLNSKSRDWPDGLANRSGLVGRNLMLHTSDFIAIDPKEDHSAKGPEKSMALNDFYHDDGMKLGTFQSVGMKFEPSFIEAYLQYVCERDPQWWRAFVRPFLRPASERALHYFKQASLFATIVEDLPYRNNRVVPDPQAASGMRFEYKYTRDLLKRNRHFRKRIRQTLQPRHKVSVVTFGNNNINYGHVCGTCRFGEDPETSILDNSNRAHDLDNLYVVDASFFPSSGGTNPSLTIAANAIRVGGILNERLP